MATFTHRISLMIHCLTRFCIVSGRAFLVAFLLYGSLSDLKALETKPPIFYRSVLLHFSGAVGTGNEIQLGLQGKYIQTIGKSPWSFLTGIHARMLEDGQPILFPSSYRLRNYPEPDRLLGPGLRIWSTGWSVGLLYRLSARTDIFILPEIATISTGKNIDFSYFSPSGIGLYSPVQSAKPSPAGLLNPILRLKGSMQMSAGVQIRLLPHWVLVFQYQRVRYEFTTYKLLNFRNDRFMKSLDQFGIGLGYCFVSR